MPIVLSIKTAQDIAAKRNGKCLSIKYIDCKQKLLWQCEKNHQWHSSLNNIKNNNQWCTKCFHGKRLNGLKIANKIAESKNGKCLSTKYIGINNKMHWECNFEHQWHTTLNHIKNSNQWCPKCVGNIKLDIDILQQIAKSQGGELLSTKYINLKTKMHWKCVEGHRWWAETNSIKNNNQWCPICAPKKREQTNIKRYGVSNPMQNLEIALRAAKSQNNSYILHHWKTGEELICQASWEKKVVGYFNENEINFKWQSRVFRMPNGKTYRPDLYLFSTKKWIEIKGYFRKDALEKWDWFHKEKPNSELWDKAKLKSMGIL